MTIQEKVMKNKVGLLKLGKGLRNVSRACKIFGYSRGSSYRFKELHDRGVNCPAGTKPTQALSEEPGGGGGGGGYL